MGCGGSTQSFVRASGRKWQRSNGSEVLSWRTDAPLTKEELGSIAAVNDVYSRITAQTVLERESTVTASLNGMVRRIYLPPDHWVELELGEREPPSLQIFLIQCTSAQGPVAYESWKITLPDLTPEHQQNFARLMHHMIREKATWSPDALSKFLKGLETEFAKDDGKVNWPALVEAYGEQFPYL